jgi:hypothetical protein
MTSGTPSQAKETARTIAQRIGTMKPLVVTIALPDAWATLMRLTMAG